MVFAVFGAKILIEFCEEQQMIDVDQSSLAIELHDIVVWQAANRALLASSSALDACRHVSTWDEGRIALVFIAQLAHLGWLISLN